MQSRFPDMTGRKLVEIDWYDRSDESNTGVWRFTVPESWDNDEFERQMNAAAQAAIANPHNDEIDEDSTWGDFFDANVNCLPEGMEWFLPQHDLYFDCNRERSITEEW